MHYFKILISHNKRIVLHHLFPDWKTEFVRIVMMSVERGGKQKILKNYVSDKMVPLYRHRPCRGLGKLTLRHKKFVGKHWPY